LGIKSSVKEAPEFFHRIKYQIGGFLYSPDDIEHGILRGNARTPVSPLKPFRRGDPRHKFVIKPMDPRIHFALVCGSRSCPPIDYYEAKIIHEQLNRAATSFVNSSEVIALPEEGKLLISKIFRWYEKDFGGRKGVLRFIQNYLTDKKANAFLQTKDGAVKIEYLDYDWNLNRGK